MSQSFIYHHVPIDMIGTTLYPLNQLKKDYPELYQFHRKKYEKREHILEQRIPVLNNCLWNDVLFFSTIHPQLLFDARREAGWPNLQPQLYFKVDANSLEQDLLALHPYEPEQETNRGISPTAFIKYTPGMLEEYSAIRPETIHYFKILRQQGAPKIPLFYRYVPHILYKGSLETSNLEIIEVQ